MPLKVKSCLMKAEVQLTRAMTVTIVLLTTVVFDGCATHARPLGITPRVALTPTKDRVTMQARPGKSIGEIVPVDVSVANGTDEPYLIVPNQVFAIDQQGQKILAVPPSEAIQEAGDANALKAGLTGAAKNAAIGLVAGAVIGAAIGRCRRVGRSAGRRSRLRCNDGRRSGRC
jgi:hypothetical protein